MKAFNHINASSFQEASSIISDNNNGESIIMAGGTDLMNVLKEALLPEYPKTIVNIKKITGAEGITIDRNGVSIGSLTKLVDIAESPIIKTMASGLGEAAHSVASALVRNVGTIGGNVCQDVRCWYWRYPHSSGGRMVCQRKGGSECYAIRGDNRYHSIFGGMQVDGNANPCSLKCPADTDIPAYMERLRKNDYQEAANIIMQANPMPMITSRVCAHTCQNGCNRCGQDESVNIHAVERSIGDYILEHMKDFYKMPSMETGNKIAIIGSGPAGLSAAYFLRVAGNDVTVYDSMEEAGGLLTYAIPSYRLPKNYVHKLVTGLKNMGIKFQLSTTVGKDISINVLEDKFHRIFFATGAWKRPVLGFDGEEFTEFGLQFLMQVSQWTDKKQRNNVLVTGGGNVAMDVAITVKRMGAKNVILACLEDEPHMPASVEEIERAREEGITIMPSWGISRAFYQEDKVTGMELKRCLSVTDETGRFNPLYDENEKIVIQADSILMAVGQQGDLSFLGEKYDIAVNRGLIKVDDNTQQTSNPNILAGGDVTTGPKTVVQAIRAGRNAAERMNSDFGLSSPKKEARVGLLHFDVESLENHTAVKIPELSKFERTLDKEDTGSLSFKATLKEAKRCMNCGCYSVNASDISPMLVAMNADIITTRETIKAVDFFTKKLKVNDILESGELVKAIHIADMSPFVTHYEKMRIRSSIDFAIVSCASVYKLVNNKISEISIVLGGVAPVPYKLYEVEEFLVGKEISPELVEHCVDLAMKNAMPLDKNTYKISETRSILEHFLNSIGK